MAGQPWTMGDMQAYLDGFGLLTTANANAEFAKFLEDPRFITAADLRQLGYAPAEEVRATILKVIQRENLQNAELRNDMQTWCNQACDLSSGFDARAATATANVVAGQAKLIESFEARDKQLQEHIDAAQTNNFASLEMLKGQVATFTEHKQSELLVLCEG